MAGTAKRINSLGASNSSSKKGKLYKTNFNGLKNFRYKNIIAHRKGECSFDRAIFF